MPATSLCVNCTHLGKPTGQVIKCGTCPGNFRQKEYTCTHPEIKTTTLAVVECIHFQPKAPPNLVDKLPPVRETHFPRMPLAAQVEQTDDVPPCTCTPESLAAAKPPGWCERIRRRMTNNLFHLCQSRPDHRSVMECSAARLPPVPPQRVQPCVHLGEVIDHRGTACGQQWVRKCKKHGRCALNERSDSELLTYKICRTCPDYALSMPGSSTPATVRHEDPACGVVIGCYWMPTELVDLQIRTIRANCGPVPILISDDASPGKRDEYYRIEESYSDVTVRISDERIGHAGGDVAVFYRGLVWAQRRKLRVLAKLSQRFVIDLPYWLQEGANGLLASGLTLGAQVHVDGPGRLPLRTEACLLDVHAWAADDVLSQMIPGTKGGVAELLMAALGLRIQPEFWRWPLLTSDRKFPMPRVLWHRSNSTDEYRALAAKYDITLPADFTLEGWGEIHARGADTYLPG